MYKRLLFALLMVLSVAVSPFFASSAKAVALNTLIKIEGNPTVYWHATDAKRYVFPNPRTFYSWFTSEDLGRVVTISPQELGRITIGGNVTYRPGVRLIKVTTDPRVYAVSRYGTLRWITSEALAAQLYGQNWARQVDDVPDAFFTNYTVGEAIYTASQFNPAFEVGQARTPSENVRLVIGDPLPLRPGSIIGQARLRLSNTTPRVGDTVTYSADLVNTSNNAADVTISIVSITGETLRTCTGALSCSHSLYIGADMSGFGRTYYANATHRNGHRIGSEGVTLQVGGTVPFAPATAHTLTISAGSVLPGESFTVTSRLTPDTTGAPYYTIRIYDQWNVLQHTCLRVRTCVLQQTLSPTTDTSRSYYATAIADTGSSQLLSPTQRIIVESLTTEQLPASRLGESRPNFSLTADSAVGVSPLVVMSGKEVRLSAQIIPALAVPTGAIIKFMDAQGNGLFSCSNQNSCSGTYLVTNASSQSIQAGFKVSVEDQYGTRYESNTLYATVRSEGPQAEAFSATLIASASPSSVEANVPFRLTAEVKGYNIPMEKIGVAWYQEDGQLVGTCTAKENCLIDTSYGLFTSPTLTMKFYFTAWDISGTKTGTLRSSLQTVTIHSVESVTPTPEVFSATLTGRASPDSVESDVRFDLIAEVRGYNITMDKIAISWYQEDGMLIDTCTGNENCLRRLSYTVHIGNTGPTRTERFYFTARDTSGSKTGVLRSALYTVTISL